MDLRVPANAATSPAGAALAAIEARTASLESQFHWAIDALLNGHTGEPEERLRLTADDLEQWASGFD